MYEQCEIYFSWCLYFYVFRFVSLQNTFCNFHHLGFTQLYSSYILTTNKLELKRLLCTRWIDAVTVKRCLDSLRVASQPGDWKCIFKLSRNSVTSNSVRSKLPANREIKSLFSSCLRTVCIKFCSVQVASRPGDWKCVFKLSSNSATSIRFESPVDGEITSTFASYVNVYQLQVVSHRWIWISLFELSAKWYWWWV